MTERVNLVDAYDNRSVVAKLVNMEERISGAESSIEKTVEDGEKSIDTKVDTGVTKINSLLTGLDDTIAKAETAASTAETASTKAETAAKSVDEDIVAANNAVLDAQGYATTGKLHDGTAVTSASNIAKSCETYADTASKAVTQAQASATAAAASQTAAGQNAASAEASAKDASGYLDTVKASADAAEASATAAAASALQADEAAASIDASNLVTLSTDQTIEGAKQMTNGSNAFKCSSRASSASTTDILNSGDINTPSGKYNMLLHRSGKETSTNCIQTMSWPEHLPRGMNGQGRSGNYWHTLYAASPTWAELKMTTSTNGYYLEGYRLRVIMDMHTQLGDASVEFIIGQVLDKTSGSTNYYHYELKSYKVLKNEIVAAGSSTITIKLKSDSTYRNVAAYFIIGYTTVTSPSGATYLPYSLDVRAGVVAPALSSGVYDICFYADELYKLPTSAIESSVVAEIPINVYTEE